MKFEKTILVAIILIIVLGFAVYINSLNGEFLWDDNHLIKNNVYIKNWSNTGKIFSENILKGSGIHYNFYRPLQVLTYMFDYSFWKLDVGGYHLTNILLHILVALTIFWLINILYKDWLLALFTSLFFVVHPLHTEAVAYISGRADSLAALFMLLCLILYIKAAQAKNIIIYILMLASYIVALLSRENSLILPLVVLLYHHSFKGKLKMNLFLPIVTLAAAYSIFRLTLLKTILVGISYSTTLLQRIPGFFVALTNYLKLLILPFNLHMEYENQLFNFTNPQAIIGMLIFLSLLVYTFRQRKNHGLTFFGICWFFIFLLPSSNLYPINAYMAEHWLYLPCIGFFLIIAQGLKYLYRTKQLKILISILAVFFISFYSYLTIKQNTYWRDPITLYERTLKYVPGSPRLYNNLSVIYSNQGEYEKATSLYKKAIELNPKYTDAYNNLANIYSKMGRYQDAVPLYKKAIELNPDFAGAYNNLGNAYRDSRRYKEAISAYKKAIEIKPGHPEAYNNLGAVYYDLGQKEEAIASLKKAIKINPDLIGLYDNLARVCREVGKNEEAIALYKKKIEINPRQADTYNELGVVYKSIKKYEQAIDSYKKAIEIKPGFAKAYYNLANTYRDIDKHQQAITFYNKAIRINPGYAEAYNNLGLVYQQLGQIKEAVQAFKKTLEVAPGYNRAYNNLAVLYFYQKQYKLAIEYCDKAIKKGFKVQPKFLELLEPYRE